MKVQNLWAGIPAVLAEELVEVIAAGTGVRVERIVSRGHTTAPGFWYDQDWAEWVLVLQGKGRLIFENRPYPVDLGPGDHLLIEPHMRHRVIFTDPDQETIWLAVHFGK